MPQGAFTKAGAELLLNRGMRNTGSAVTQWYLGLATVAVTATDTLGTITEVSTAGYSRQPVTIGAPSGTDPVIVASTGAAVFGPFSADPPSVAYGFLTDAASGTTGIIGARWTDAAEDAGTSESLSVPAGEMQIGIDTTETAI